MIECKPCPQCGKPVMPYGRYLKEMAGTPSKISKCSHCQTEVMRNPSILTLLSVGSVALVVLLFYVAPRFVPSSGWAGLGALLIVGTAGVFFLNFCGWLLVGWRCASAPSSAKAEGSQPEATQR
jgi:hypothetical protein